MYGLYYTFFECIPTVYIRTYKFTNPDVGLSFLSISVGALVGTVLLEISPSVRPKRTLVPALYASVIMPASLPLFGQYDYCDTRTVSGAD
jgi:DHA1 family multidrug resistance protein-like MFS transporter